MLKILYVVAVLLAIVELILLFIYHKKGGREHLHKLKNTDQAYPKVYKIGDNLTVTETELGFSVFDGKETTFYKKWRF